MGWGLTGFYSHSKGLLSPSCQHVIIPLGNFKKNPNPSVPWALSCKDEEMPAGETGSESEVMSRENRASPAKRRPQQLSRVGCAGVGLAAELLAPRHLALLGVQGLHQGVRGQGGQLGC